MSDVVIAELKNDMQSISQHAIQIDLKNIRKSFGEKEVLKNIHYYN